MNRRWRSLPLGLATAAIGVVLAAPGPVMASCPQLDLAAIPRTDATTVFSGTVQAVQAGHVFLQVDAWFLGKDPVESAEVSGGRESNDPGVITSVDWTPQPGERYLVVAERAAPEGFVTKPCQQVGADAGVLQQATTVFGAALLPPFAAPGSAMPSPTTAAPSHSGAASPAPSAASEEAATSASGLVPLAIISAFVLVAAALTVWRLRRRKRIA